MPVPARLSDRVPPRSVDCWLCRCEASRRGDPPPPPSFQQQHPPGVSSTSPSLPWIFPCACSLPAVAPPSTLVLPGYSPSHVRPVCRPWRWYPTRRSRTAAHVYCCYPHVPYSDTAEVRWPRAHLPEAGLPSPVPLSTARLLKFSSHHVVLLFKKVAGWLTRAYRLLYKVPVVTGGLS